METGKTYTVTHQRKGRFTMQVTSKTAMWTTGIITKGTAGAMLEYNVKHEGEKITVRTTFLSNIKELETN